MLQCSHCIQNSPSFSCEQSVMPSGPSILSMICAIVICLALRAREITSFGAVVAFDEAVL